MTSPLPSRRAVVAVLALLGGWTPGANAQAPLPLDSVGVEVDRDPHAFFYRPLDYGSATVVGALPLLLNRGLHISRVYTGVAELRALDQGLANVWLSITQPIEAIHRTGGVGRFARTEVFPFRYDLGASWASNYIGHTIETGIAYRTLREYYEHRGVAHPHLWATVVSLATTTLVEAYELKGKPETPQPSTVADFLLFDPLGIILLSADGPARFLSEKLGARIWPHQPGVSVLDGAVVNAGLDVVFKVKTPWSDRVKLFSRVGLGQDFGVSVSGRGDLNYSLAVGWVARDHNLDAETGEETIRLSGSTSFFIDRNESLLASVLWQTRNSRALAVNVYPGALGFLPQNLGFWIAATDWGDRIYVGLSHSRLKGLGLTF